MSFPLLNCFKQAQEAVDHLGNVLYDLAQMPNQEAYSLWVILKIW